MPEPVWHLFPLNEPGRATVAHSPPFTSARLVDSNFSAMVAGKSEAVFAIYEPVWDERLKNWRAAKVAKCRPVTYQQCLEHVGRWRSSFFSSTPTC